MLSPKTAAILIAIGLLLLPLGAAAHGVELSYETVQGIEITARYDSGEPMAGGQVAVYSDNH